MRVPPALPRTDQPRTRDAWSACRLHRHVRLQGAEAGGTPTDGAPRSTLSPRALVRARPDRARLPGRAELQCDPLARVVPAPGGWRAPVAADAHAGRTPAPQPQR